jgi:DNA helicase-2/ATP-dependent DNA helicase PcrA
LNPAKVVDGEPIPTVGRDDARVADLTVEQRVAAGTATRGVFIEAGPGTGKTTVAAHRYGALRYRAVHRNDPRAVVAVSFTRSATWTLRRRVHRFYGPASTSWPHRIVTLDSIMVELLHHLLATGLVRWFGGVTELKVEDSWSVLGETFWTKRTYRLRLAEGKVVGEVEHAEKAAQRPDLKAIGEKLSAGICTHEDVRAVVAEALAVNDLKASLRARLAASTRALIVDECFDANELDIAILHLAVDAGIDVTLVGDPWQALYLFRGARPELVWNLITKTGLRVLPLTQSFRWRSEEQASLALDLRAGIGVTLTALGADEIAEAAVEVVLATEWKPLWELGEMVLPLAFHAFKGTAPEAAATILLNQVTRSVLGEDATYVRDSLTALAIDDPAVSRQLEGALAQVLELLKTPGRPAAAVAWDELVRVLGTVSPRHIQPAHWRYTDRLQLVATRLAHQHRPVAGLTIHQAKGREWDAVGMRLSEAQRALLATGLSSTDDIARKIYVGATRARRHTYDVGASSA